MTVPPAPIGERPYRPAQAARRRLLFDYVVSLPRLPPKVREAQKVKRSRPFRRRGLPMATLHGPLERHQPRLCRVERQTILTKTLRQDFLDTLCVLGDVDTE